MEATDNVLDEVLKAEQDIEAAELHEEEEPAADDHLEELSDPEPRRGLDESDAMRVAALAPAGAADLDLVERRNIADVPLWYERAGPPRPSRFPVAPGFLPVLERTVRHVRQRTPPEFGELIRISSAGMYVAKPGMHGRGRACDWDRWVFANAEIAPKRGDHASSSLRKRRRYWALAAICRSNSCFVLHGRYDADHRDHIHQDNMIGVEFNTRRSTVTLCQAVLNDIFDQSPRLAIDGHLGPKTREALRRAKETLDLTGDLADVAVWQRFLRRSARLGFRLSVGG